MSDNYFKGDFVDPVTKLFKSISKRALEVSAGVFRDMVSAPEGVIASATFMPTAAQAYAAGNVIDTFKPFVFTFADGGKIPQGAVIRVMSVVSKLDATALLSGEGAYTLHGYSIAPPSNRANGAAWSLPTGDLAAYRGSIPIGTPDFTLGRGYSKLQLGDKQDFHLASDTLYAELVNAAAFTGAAVGRQFFIYGYLV